MARCRISVEITEYERTNIEKAVRKNYPKLKNISDVVRAALSEFLKQEVT